MLNIDRLPLTADQERFLDDMGSFFAGYGLAHPVGRAFGYLLLRNGPVTLDQIAADLQISKSGASTIARALSNFRLARRVPERGSRRIRYEATSAVDLLIASAVEKLTTFVGVLTTGVRAAPAGAPSVRLEELARITRLYRDAVETALQGVKDMTAP